MEHHSLTPMKILIFGGDGMLGHQLLRQWTQRHDVVATVRGSLSTYAGYGLYNVSNCIPNIDVRATDDVLLCLRTVRPHVIINAVGLIKQRSLATDALSSLELNSVFPHRLAINAELVGARLIHFSTDCVFSGRQGGYTEHDTPDPVDVYGRTKLLGELVLPHCLTLRTSIIGRELSRKASLVEWLLAQRLKVKGFARAIYSGFTTLEMARILETLLVAHPDAHGLWHVSSEPITKYDLLHLLRKHFALDLLIERDEDFVCDRSLVSDRFRDTFSYHPPSWDQMIKELAGDKDFYQ